MAIAQTVSLRQVISLNDYPSKNLVVTLCSAWQ